MSKASATVALRAAMLAAICVCAAGLVGLVAVAGAQSTHPDATRTNVRVLGRFLMLGKVTVAVGVPGERPGERVARTWRIRPYGCAESDCRRVVLVRNRGAQRESKLTLSRVGAGIYRGTGRFWAPLRCLGRTEPHGSLAPYLLTLAVTRWTQRGAIRYATAISATYTNSARRDQTPCPIGIVHDAAHYTGSLKSPLPAAPPAPAPTTTTAPAPAPTTTTAPAPTPTTTTAPAPTSTTTTGPTAPTPTAPAPQ